MSGEAAEGSEIGKSPEEPNQGVLAEGPQHLICDSEMPMNPYARSVRPEDLNTCHKSSKVIEAADKSTVYGR